MGQKIIGASSEAVPSSMVIQNSHEEVLQCSRQQNVTLNNTTFFSDNLGPGLSQQEYNDFKREYGINVDFKKQWEHFTTDILPLTLVYQQNKYIIAEPPPKMPTKESIPYRYYQIKSHISNYSTVY